MSKDTLVVSRAHTMIMNVLFITHGDPILALVSLTGLSQPELTRLLGELKRFGYVESNDDVYFRLTEKGEQHVCLAMEVGSV